MTAAIAQFAPNDIEARRQGLGGSDVAAALGYNPYCTPLQLWMEKTGRSDRGEAGEPAYWGTVLEPQILRRYREVTGKKVRRDNRTLAHPDHPFIFGHIDARVVGENRGIEAKTVNAWAKGWGQAGSDDAPDWYLTQVHTYMGIWGFEAMDVACLIGGQRFQIFPVNRDRELEEMILQGCADFWRNHVEADVAPPAATNADLTILHGMGQKDKAVKASPDILTSITMLRDLKARAKELETQIRTQELKVKTYMGEAQKLTNDGKPVATWTTVTSRRLDQTALSKARPGLLEQYKKESQYRRFMLKKEA